MNFKPKFEVLPGPPHVSPKSNHAHKIADLFDGGGGEMKSSALLNLKLAILRLTET